MRVNVAGGTGAGTKRPLKPATFWKCDCAAPADEQNLEMFPHRRQPSWRLRCQDCGAVKP